MSNDHYVPQFYLGNFSPDSRERDCVCLINIDRRRFVPTASIKGQCKKAGLHDYQPGLEAALCQLEGLAAAAIRTTLFTSRPPKLRSPDHEVLAAFTVIQRSRTLNTAEATEKLFDRMMTLAYEEEARAQGIDLSNFTIRSEHPVALPLSIGAQLAPIAMQLGLHLLLNETEEEFITSDDPAIAHNQYCEGIDYQGVLGWDCFGFQVLLPLSPRHLALFYDANTYTVGTKRSRDFSKISNVDEVRNLNAFQVANARQNIYFSDLEMKPSLLAQIDNLRSTRHFKRQVTVQSAPVPYGDGSRELIHQFQRMLPVRLAIRNIRIKRNMKRIPLSQRARMIRRDLPPTNRYSRADCSDTIEYVAQQRTSD